MATCTLSHNGVWGKPLQVYTDHYWITGN